MEARLVDLHGGTSEDSWTSGWPGPLFRDLRPVARDISQHVAAQAELRASEARYRQLLQAMDKGILVQDARGRIESAARVLRPL